MTETTQRLRRDLDDDPGDCRSGDIERRLDELGAGWKDGRWKKYRAIELVTVLDGCVDDE